MNASIYNANNENVGDINDFIIGDNGEIAHVVVGVGGFLGLGETNVMIEFDQLQFAKNENGEPRITTSMTKEELQRMADAKADGSTGMGTTTGTGDASKPATAN